MNKRLLIIGLDGVSWNVINPMIENGYMPFLKDFIKNGKCDVLQSTEPPITPTAWTSFSTGLMPEDHGIYGFRNFQFKDGKFSYELNNSSDIVHKTIFQILSEHNKKVCAINIPLTYPPFKVNGIMVSGFPTPSGDGCNYTYPTDFKKELLQEIPGYRSLDYGEWASGIVGSVKVYVKRLCEMTSQKALLSSYLLNKEDWDFFMVHFQETDFLQHAFWHYIDKTHPDYTLEGFKECANYYNYLDNQLSKIVSLAKDKGYSILIISDHGFQKCEYDVRINNWLFSKGYLYVKHNFKNIIISELKKIIKMLSSNLKLKIKSENTTFNFNNRYLNKMIDYEKSIVFIESNSTNVAYAHFIKNEPEVKEPVINSLLNLKTAQGKKIITSISPVTNAQNIYKVIFENGIVVSGTIISKEPWCVTRKVGKSAQIGIHHSDGIIIADGMFKSQDLPEKIYQVFDFILKLQDVKYSTKTNMRDKIKSLSNEEQEKIEKSLKSLGYL